MAYYPDTVDLKKLPAKPVPLRNTKWAIIDDLTFRGRPKKGFIVRVEEDPRDSNPHQGAAVFNQTLRQIEALVRKQLRKKRK